MGKIRIVIVDDSAFSIAFIRDILENADFEVVGEAKSLEEVKTVIEEKRPALVTMDMTLPGTDGLECTRAVHAIDPSIKVIVVSSMMDDEILREAKNNNVSGYVQKPVDADELVTAIHRVMDAESLFEFLEHAYFPVFKEALLDGMNKMTKTLLEYQEEYECKDEHVSFGMMIIIGIIGKFSGRLMIDLSLETAERITTALLRREPTGIDEINGAISEFTNIISGNACSMLNKQNKALGLRVSPPSILRGEALHVTAPEFRTFTTRAVLPFGEILLNVGFKKEEQHWI